MKYRKLLFLTLLVSFVLPSYAEKIANGFSTTHSLGVSYQPLGLLLDSKIHYKLPLVPRAGILWESTKIEIGLQNEWTPADNLVSCRLTIEPIALFDIVAKAGFYSMYDLFGFGCFHLASSDLRYSPAVQKQLDPTGAAGYWLSVTPTLKAKFGHFIALNSLTVNRISINQGGYYLEVRSYLPHKSTDTDLINEAFLLCEFNSQYMAGVNYRHAYVLSNGLKCDRICGLFIFKPSRAPAGLYTALKAGAYANDPLYRGNFYLAGQVGTDFRIGSK